MHEAVGLFKNMDQLQEAVKELERTEFPRDALSVMSHQAYPYPSYDQLNMGPFNPDDLEAPVRSEEKTIGAGVLIGGATYLGAMATALTAGAATIPAFITAAAIGGIGGAATGGILAKLLGDHFDHEIENQVNAGGLLLWVRTPDEHKEEMACKILKDYGADFVSIREH